VNKQLYLKCFVQRSLYRHNMSFSDIFFKLRRGCVRNIQHISYKQLPVDTNSWQVPKHIIDVGWNTTFDKTHPQERKKWLPLNFPSWNVSGSRWIGAQRTVTTFLLFLSMVDYLLCRCERVSTTKSVHFRRYMSEHQ